MAKRRRLIQTKIRVGPRVAAAVVLVLGLAACQPTNATTALSSDVGGATNVTYDFSADFDVAPPHDGIRCIEITFSNRAYGQGGIPAGMDISATSVVASGATDAYNWSGWSTTGNNGTGKVRITKSSSSDANLGRVHIAIAGVTNPAAPGTYWAMAEFKTDQTCAGSTETNEPVNAFFAIDGADAAVANTNAQIVIEPSLSFSVYNSIFGCNGVANSGSASPTAVTLGSITGASQKSASQALNVVTNAPNGFVVYMRALSPMSLASVPGTHAAPAAFPAVGTEAFGFTTGDTSVAGGTANRFTSGGAKWAALPSTNQEVFSSLDSAVNCVGYRAGASATSAPGTYSASIAYTAVGMF